MIGQKVCFFTSLHSTNTFMKEHMDEFKHGHIVCAEIQTAGRGRRDHHWISVKGNLHISLFIEDKNSVITPFEMITLISNTVIETLNVYGIKADIKYPNDIVVQGKKIAGILIEHVNDTYIAGVGINIVFTDHDIYDFEPSSIKYETGEMVDYRDVLSAFISAYNTIEKQTKEDLFKTYKEHSMIIGKQIQFDQTTYTVQDITTHGELILHRDHQTVIVPLNEISLHEVYGHES